LLFTLPVGTFHHYVHLHDVMALICLNNGNRRKRVEIPIYDFTTHSRRPETSTVYGANVVIFEGIFALYDKTITDLMDLKVHVSIVCNFFYSSARLVLKTNYGLRSLWIPMLIFGWLEDVSRNQ